MNLDKETIRRRALALTQASPNRVGTRLAAEFGISRQVASGYLQALCREGLLDGDGSTRARLYRLRVLASLERTFPRPGLDEDVVWRETVAPTLGALPKEVRTIWQYGVTEIVNNAIDHSGAAEVRVDVRRNALFSEVIVSDDGEGIFLKIQRAFDLPDPRLAILELAKGKLTTAPSHHSGEGIFFTSRAMDDFSIASGLLHFHHRGRALDTLIESPTAAQGTVVTLRLDNESPRTLRSVFDQFADDPEEYSFDKTEVPVRLAQQGDEALVSRSQAKRVAARFDRFKHVTLDFEGIEQIGQAFADELFRVFAREHPNVRLAPVNTAPAVAQMIRRVVGAAAQSTPEK